MPTELDPLALEALKTNQRQLDAGGCEVGVSRQALDELIAAYESRASVSETEPTAVIRFQRAKAGHENEMPQVVSCNWLPDGEYRLFTHPAPSGMGVKPADAAKEILDTVQQWHNWAFEWSGSAFIADEALSPKDMTEGECKSALYSDLCKLGNHMAWLHERLTQALIPPAGSDAGEALSPITDRGIEGQIMDAAWPEYGGDLQTSEFWTDFGEGVAFAVKKLAQSPTVGEITEAEVVRAARAILEARYPGTKAEDIWLDPAAVKDARAALSAAALTRLPDAGKPPKGWRLVPEAPTVAMIMAYDEMCEKLDLEAFANARLAWSSMLDAAPLPDAQPDTGRE